MAQGGAPVDRNAAESAGCAVQGDIVEQVRVALRGSADIDLDVAEARADRGLDGGQRILRRVLLETAMSDDLHEMIIAPRG